MTSYMIEASDKFTGTWTFDGVCTESVEDCAISTEADAVKLAETMRGWTGWENGHYRVVEVEMDSSVWPGYTVVREVVEFSPIAADDDDEEFFDPYDDGDRSISY
jgi:hypothetical protein